MLVTPYARPDRETLYGEEWRALFHQVEGQGANCPLPGTTGSTPAWEEKLLPQWKQFGCTVSVHITTELVPISLFVQHCTLYNLTDFLARQLYTTWRHPGLTLQNFSNLRFRERQKYKDRYIHTYIHRRTDASLTDAYRL